MFYSNYFAKVALSILFIPEQAIIVLINTKASAEMFDSICSKFNMMSMNWANSS